MIAFISVTLLSILFGILCAVIANNKGYNIFGWYVLGLLLGPIGLIFAILVKKQRSFITSTHIRLKS